MDNISYKILVIWVGCLLFFIQVFSQTIPKDSLFFVSDTQKPMWIETIFLKKDKNELATQRIFEDFEHLRARNIFITGDLVSAGSKTKKWKKMDAWLSTLRYRQDAKVWACIGNHEYFFSAEKGESFFKKRFPQYIRTGYYTITDSIAVIFLNSNFSKLTEKEINQQQTWYKTTLQKLSMDKSVLNIIVTCHHAPYSNSKVVGSSKPVQEKFVPDFLQTDKCKLFISGHSHNFEHFQQGGKDFLVIGGGGGLKQPLKNDDSKIPALDTNFKPMFHYLIISRQENTLHITVREIQKDYSGFFNGLQFPIR